MQILIIIYLISERISVYGDCYGAVFRFDDDVEPMVDGDGANADEIENQEEGGIGILDANGDRE